MTSYPVILDNIFTQNLIIFGFLFFCFLLFLRKKPKNSNFISPEISTEIKWLAILCIVAIHTSYEIAKNWEFLHPLAAFAGLWVDIFLLLSGYGLTMSHLKKPLSITNFYKKRLLKIFFPFWIAILIFYILDFFFLSKTYSTTNIIQSFLVFFPTAEIWNDFNSPLWYLSWLLFFYILFPIIFIKKYPLISAIIMYILALIFIKINPLDMHTNWLHALHCIAFPLGMVLAIFSDTINIFLQKKIFSSRTKIFWIFTLAIIFFIGIWSQNIQNFPEIIAFFEHFWNGQHIFEQLKNILLIPFLLAIFIFSPFKNSFLGILGIFSYEIYLLHWPLMSRYDVFFGYFPTWIAMILWILTLLLVAYIFQKFIQFLDKKFL